MFGKFYLLRHSYIEVVYSFEVNFSKIYFYWKKSKKRKCEEEPVWYTLACLQAIYYHHRSRRSLTGNAQCFVPDFACYKSSNKKIT